MMYWRYWSWPVRILVGLSGCVLVAAFLFPVFARAREPKGNSCYSNLKQIGLGFMQYAQDYDESMPPVAIGSKDYGWANALQPYLKSTHIFQCPSEPDKGQPDPRKSKYTDYWYNAHLSRIGLALVNETNEIIVAGDGNDGAQLTDARYSLFALPDQWLTDTSSPSSRHLDIAFYLFLDGHVNSLKPKDISTNASNSQPHFEPK